MFSIAKLLKYHLANDYMSIPYFVGMFPKQKGTKSKRNVSLFTESHKIVHKLPLWHWNPQFLKCLSGQMSFKTPSLFFICSIKYAKLWLWRHCLCQSSRHCMARKESELQYVGAAWRISRGRHIAKCTSENLSELGNIPFLTLHIVGSFLIIN